MRVEIGAAPSAIDCARQILQLWLRTDGQSALALLARRKRLEDAASCESARAQARAVRTMLMRRRSQPGHWR